MRGRVNRAMLGLVSFAVCYCACSDFLSWLALFFQGWLTGKTFDETVQRPRVRVELRRCNNVGETQEMEPRANGKLSRGQSPEQPSCSSRSISPASAHASEALYGGPGVYFTVVAKRRQVITAAIPLKDPHGSLFDSVDQCSRSSLRHLQSLRRTFGLVGGLSTRIVHTLPLGMESPGMAQRPNGGACDFSASSASLASVETRQRRLLADMFVAQWKRLQEQYDQAHSEMVREALNARQQADDRRAAKARQEHEAFSNGLAFLRNATKPGGTVTSNPQLANSIQ